MDRTTMNGRRKALERMVPMAARGLVRRSDSAACGSKGVARIVDAARQVDSTYEAGKRSPLWRKVKLEHEQAFIIGGYTLPTAGGRRRLC